jgi:hypothetical protein
VPGKKFDDGTDNVGGYSSNPSFNSALPQYFSTALGTAIPDPDSGLAGTDAEQQLVAALLHASGSTSAITTLLAGPILRGTTVSQESG